MTPAPSFGAAAASSPFAKAPASPAASPFGAAAAPLSPAPLQGPLAGAAANAAAAPSAPGTVVTLPEAPADSVSCLRFCAGADLLAASAWDGTVRVWDLRSGAAAARHAATYTHAKPAMSVALAPSGERVVSGGADRAVRAFDLSSGQLGLIGEHKDAVSCVAVSADMPQVVLSGSWDRTLVCWDLREGPASVQQVSLNEKVHDLDVRWPFALVGGASPGQALLFDVRKAKGALTSTVCKTSQHLAGHPPRCVALFPKGLYDKGDSSGFCVGAYEGRVGVHFGPTTAAAPATGSKEWGDDFTFKCHRTPAATGGGAVQVYAVNALAFNPRASEQLATAGADGEVWMWDLKRRMAVHKPLVPRPAGAEVVGVPSISFSSSGTLLAYAFSDDWTAGEERYQRLCTAGHSNAVKVIAVPEA